ncbi:MAG: DinB family protein [Anaerolineae bacterium]|nr:DinB family protein [Anaerolineae bacterium]
MNSEERNEKIELYGKGFEMLMETLKAIPREAWKFRPAPGEWSIHEVIVHLADSETNSALRARLLAAEPARVVMAYDQDKWAAALNYHDQDVDDALQFTKYARLTTYKWLKTLPDEVFFHTVIHPEYDEPYSFEKWLNIYVGHIPGHIAQIEANYEAWKSSEQ